MGMVKYIIKRTFVAIALILFVATLNFAIVHLAPGGPMAVLLAQPRITPQGREQLLESYGLTQPIYVQYDKYITGLFTGNWGVSYYYLEPAYSVIAQRVPATLLLMIPSVALTVVIGIGLGIVSARKPFSHLDKFLSSLSFFFYAMPAFWLGFLFLTLFAVDLRVLPAGGMHSIVNGGSLLDLAYHLILPMICLALVNLANFSLLVRTSMIDVLDQNYITTARGKGLSEHTIFFRHALRNGLLPAVTMIGLFTGGLLGGAILTETVFTWPGLGLLTFSSIIARDYPVVLSLFFIFSVMVIAANLVTDIVYGLLDPRIKYE